MRRLVLRKDWKADSSPSEYSYHTTDLAGNETSNLPEALALFSEALDTWLPCFVKKESNTTTSTPSSSASAFGSASASATPTGAASRRDIAVVGPVVIVVTFIVFGWVI